MSEAPLTHRRDVLVSTLIYHYRKNSESCGCGWGELGHSHPEHVADVYEMSLRAFDQASPSETRERNA
jgi:hypothetical protein